MSNSLQRHFAVRTSPIETPCEIPVILPDDFFSLIYQKVFGQYAGNSNLGKATVLIHAPRTGDLSEPIPINQV